jgi:hypothetical protein
VRMRQRHHLRTGHGVFQRPVRLRRQRLPGRLLRSEWQLPLDGAHHLRNQR